MRSKALEQMIRAEVINSTARRLRDLEASLLNVRAIQLTPEQLANNIIYRERIDQLERSHSRSWFGDHSNTYFENFSPPPGGRSFDVEWGFVPGFGGSHNPGWHVYSRDAVRNFILDGLGEGIFYAWRDLEDRVTKEYSNIWEQALSVVETLQGQLNLKALARYQTRIEEKLAPYTVADFINGRLASTPKMTRDSVEIAKGETVPLQVQYLAVISAVEANQKRADSLANVLRNVIESTSLGTQVQPMHQTSPRLFIGHGRSQQWTTLRDFVRDRLHLAFDEFNRVPTAGLSTKERLTEMLDECSFALLVMTGEDEHEDGTMHARENVIHEIGLFQGCLGWRKAIVLVEEGCQQFSNIVGLGQVRYQKGNIASSFEELRRILERENIISSSLG